MVQPIETYQSPASLGQRAYEFIKAVGMSGLRGKSIHFIGAGGIGMSGLAKLMLHNQSLVSGSDQMPSMVIDQLKDMGASMHIGHCGDNLPSKLDAVVVSAAIRADNPELIMARQRGVRVIKYAEMLGEIMDFYEGIAIAGTHGKSTTSGWTSHLLRLAGVDANFLVGADVTQLGSSSGAGASEYFVAEACEYDRSFLNLRPRIACLLNIEPDHLDYYKDMDDIVDAFSSFVNGLKNGGVIVANGDDKHVTAILGELRDQCGDGRTVHIVTYGFGADCDLRAENLQLQEGTYSFDVYNGNKNLGRTHISLAGKHNVINALAVTAIALNIGVSTEKVLSLLGQFTGIDRRMMLKANHNGIVVLDDYAHHPTEIRATLSAIRERFTPKRLWCVFQPHQYSRTRFLLDDFAESFKLADVTVLPEIYFVRDSAASKEEVNSQVLADRINSNGSHAVFINDFEKIVEHLKANVSAGDLVVTMGAGDVWKVSDEYIQRLRTNS